MADSKSSQAVAERSITAHSLATPPADEVTLPGLSPGHRTWLRFRHHRLALVALGFLIFSALAAAIGPLIDPRDPLTMDFNQILAGPSPDHWLGTDQAGRDILARALAGLRGPLIVGLAGAGLCGLIGGVLGVAAGYHGGWIDQAISRVAEIILVIPGLILLMLAIGTFGKAFEAAFGMPGFCLMVIVFIGTDSWPVMMRLARAETMRLRESPFVEAARVVGTPERRTMSRHMLPHIVGVLLIQMGFAFSGFLFATGALGLFGLGPPGENPDLGQMLSNARNLDPNSVGFIVPAVIFGTLIIAGTFVGDGLRDAFDTRSQGAGRAALTERVRRTERRSGA